jgi:simple sugar transport system ATP-binding protein
MLALCDKIMVLCHGEVMGVVHADKTTKEEIGLMMTGSLNLAQSKNKKYGRAKDSRLSEKQWSSLKDISDNKGGENND